MITPEDWKKLETAAVADIRAVDPTIDQLIMAILGPIEVTPNGAVIIALSLLLGSVLSDSVLQDNTGSTFEDKLRIVTTLVTQSYNETIAEAVKSDAYGKRH